MQRTTTTRMPYRCNLFWGSSLRGVSTVSRALLRFALWANSPGRSGRLLLLLALLSLPKLAIVARAPDRTTRASKWDEYHIIKSLDASHDLAAVIGWFRGDWVERNGFYRPMTSVSLWLDYLIWRHHHRGYLVTSWILQCVTAWLLVMLTTRVMKNPACGFLSAACFSLIAFDSSRAVLSGMSTRTDGLCVVWILTGLLMAMEWIDERRPMWLIATLGSALFALWSKEMALVMPAWILLCGLIGADRKGSRRTVVLTCAVAALVLAWALCYHRFVPVSMNVRAAMLPHQVLRNLALCVAHAMPSVYRSCLWWVAGHDFSIFFFPYGWRLAAELLLTLLGAVLIVAVLPQAVVFSAGWEVASWVPLLPVKLAFYHYDYVPDIGRYIAAGAFVFSLLETGRRLTERQTLLHKGDR